MDVDFFIDENLRIWLVHIDNVVIRNNELSSMTKILRGIKLKGLEVIEKIKDKMIEDNLVLNDDEFNQILNAYRLLEDKKYVINNQFRQTLKSQENLTRKLLKLDALKKLYEGGKMKKEFNKSKLGSSMDIENMSEEQLDETKMHRMSQEQQKAMRRQIRIGKLSKAIGRAYERMKIQHGLMSEPQSQNPSEMNEGIDIEMISNASKREQMEYEQMVLRELRPNLADKNVRLIDVIDAEKKAKEMGDIDDRLVKYLERKYGKREQAYTFNNRPVQNQTQNIFAMKRPVFQKYRKNEIQIQNQKSFHKGYIVIEGDHDPSKKSSSKTSSILRNIRQSQSQHTGNQKSSNMITSKTNSLKETINSEITGLKNNKSFAENNKRKQSEIRKKENADAKSMKSAHLNALQDLHQEYKDIVNSKKVDINSKITEKRKSQMSLVKNKLDQKLEVRPLINQRTPLLSCNQEKLENFQQDLEEFQPVIDQIGSQKIDFISFTDESQQRPSKSAGDKYRVRKDDLSNIAQKRKSQGFAIKATDHQSIQNRIKLNTSQTSIQAIQAEGSNIQSKLVQEQQNILRPENQQNKLSSASNFPSNQRKQSTGGGTSIENTTGISMPMKSRQSASRGTYMKHMQRLALNQISQIQFQGTFNDDTQNLNKSSGRRRNIRVNQSQENVRFARFASLSGINQNQNHHVAESSSFVGLNHLRNDQTNNSYYNERSQDSIQDVQSQNPNQTHNQQNSDTNDMKYLQELIDLQSQPSKQVQQLRLPSRNTKSHLSFIIRKMFQPPQDPKLVPAANPFSNGQISAQAQAQIIELKKKRRQSKIKYDSLYQTQASLIDETEKQAQAESQEIQFDGKPKSFEQYQSELQAWDKQVKQKEQREQELKALKIAEAGEAIASMKTRDGNLVLCDHFQKQMRLQKKQGSNSERLLKKEKRQQLPWNRTKKTLNEFYKEYPKFTKIYPSKKTEGLSFIEQFDSSQIDSIMTSPKVFGSSNEQSSFIKLHDKQSLQNEIRTRHTEKNMSMLTVVDRSQLPKTFFKSSKSRAKKDLVSSMDEKFYNCRFKDYQKFTRSYQGDDMQYTSGQDDTDMNISSGQAQISVQNFNQFSQMQNFSQEEAHGRNGGQAQSQQNDNLSQMMKGSKQSRHLFSRQQISQTRSKKRAYKEEDRVDMVNAFYDYKFLTSGNAHLQTSYHSSLVQKYDNKSVTASQQDLLNNSLVEKYQTKQIEENLGISKSGLQEILASSPKASISKEAESPRSRNLLFKNQQSGKQTSTFTKEHVDIDDLVQFSNISGLQVSRLNHKKSSQLIGQQVSIANTSVLDERVSSTQTLKI